jgi:hypothetical protein
VVLPPASVNSEAEVIDHRCGRSSFFCINHHRQHTSKMRLIKQNLTKEYIHPSIDLIWQWRLNNTLPRRTRRYVVSPQIALFLADKGTSITCSNARIVSAPLRSVKSRMNPQQEAQLPLAFAQLLPSPSKRPTLMSKRGHYMLLVQSPRKTSMSKWDNTILSILRHSVM